MKRLTLRPNSLIGINALGVAFFGAMVAWQVSAEQSKRDGDVVSIGGSVTEIVYALGQEHRLLARDTTSVFPQAATELPDVGYVRALSPEGVLSMGPKLILAEEGAGPPEAVEVLRASAVDYVDIPEVDTPVGVAKKIRSVGVALGVPEKAEHLASEVSIDLKKIIEMVNAHPVDHPRVLFVLSVQGGRIMASGTGTAAEAIIRLAGGTNVIEGFSGYKPVTEEAIAAAKPDIILMMDRNGDHSSSNADLWSMPAFATTPAAKSNAVVRMNGLLLLGFGPRTPQAIQDLHAALVGNS